MSKAGRFYKSILVFGGPSLCDGSILEKESNRMALHALRIADEFSHQRLGAYIRDGKDGKDGKPNKDVPSFMSEISNQNTIRCQCHGVCL